MKIGSKNKNIVFYICAGKQYGLGHIFRSNRIGLFLEENGYSFSVFGNFFDNTRQYSISKNECILGDILIVDAVTIFDKDINFILNFKKRLLISPVFDKYSLITDIFTSEIKCPNNVKLQSTFFDQSFSFLGLNNDVSFKPLSDSNYVVGVCISGSLNKNYLYELLNHICIDSNISVVKLINKDYISNVPRKVFQFEGYTDNIWSFFDDIDIFITGDGIMLYESIIRGHPTISIRREKYSYKIKHLIKNNLIFSCLENDKMLPQKVAKIISSKNKLKNIKIYLKNYNIMEKLRNLESQFLKALST